jgi:NADH-quinone oxidoreductase subunit G
MIKVYVDEQEIEVDSNLTVLQACEQAGREIPRFCYHERLEIAGNCRMCLVEIEKFPKLQASCALPVFDGMKIKTTTEKVKKAREGVMELLLINHPLDCPVCDQGGECDLQDQAYVYGSDRSRYNEEKRAVEDKDFGPLIKTQMTRCIHCTRCIRFSDLIAGDNELGAIGRGEDMEITTYINKAVSSELSGNMIDLCPVGALTSKPYAFKARSWELKNTETIDIFDAVGSNIRVDAKQGEIMRILPRINEDINEEWISDKVRFAYDGLKTQRLLYPMIRTNSRLEKATWVQAYDAIKAVMQGLKGSEIAAISGNLADVESTFLLKKLLEHLGSKNFECRTNGEKLPIDSRNSYLFNSTIAGIEKSDLCLILGSNVRYDAPIINARIRKTTLQKNYPVFCLGEANNLNYAYKNLGNDIKILEQILNGTHEIVAHFKKAEFPMMILGQDLISRKDGKSVIDLCKQIAIKYGFIKEDWNGYNVLHSAAGRVGALDLGFAQSDGDIDSLLEDCKSGKIKALFMLGGDEIDTACLNNIFSIYIGHHGDSAANQASLILPAAAFTEKNATYVNTEGRIQQTTRVVFTPGDAKEDWVIINEIATVLGHKNNIENITELKKELIKDYPVFASNGLKNTSNKLKYNDKYNLSDEVVALKKYNFYMTDPISKSSKNMANCTKEFVQDLS